MGEIEGEGEGEGEEEEEQDDIEPVIVRPTTPTAIRFTVEVPITRFVNKLASSIAMYIIINVYHL